MSSTTSKVCAIFGYGPGLGDAAARLWSSKGYKVALCSRSAEKVKAAEGQIANSQGFSCDVTKPEEIENTVKSIESSLGPIDTLVYNAGSGVWKTFDKISIEDFDLAMKTNTYGLLKAAQCVAPGMQQREGCCILVTGATASLRGKPFTAGFAPAKGAQRLLAQSLARDLGPKGVHVAYFIIDGLIEKMGACAIAQTYWDVSQQPKTC